MLFFFVWRKENKWPSAARGLQLDLKQKQCLNFLEKAIKRFYSKNTELHQGKNSDCIWDLHELWKKMPIQTCKYPTASREKNLTRME